MKIIPAITSLFVLGVGITALADPSGPDKRNILPNGGFETWTPLPDPPAGKARPHLEEEKMPNGFTPSIEGAEPDGEIGITISPDSTIKHEGNYSVRIESTHGEQVGAVSLREVEVEPHTRYRVKVWMRGEGISSFAGGGVVLWTHFGPEEGYWSSPTSVRQNYKPTTSSGTFDWAPYEFTLETGADTRRLRVILQLRRATGTVWFDQLEIIPEGEADNAPGF